MSKPNKSSTKRRTKKGGKYVDEDYGYSSRRENAKSADVEKKIDQSKDQVELNLAASDHTRQRNLVVWSFNERTFVPLQMNDQTITLFHVDSQLMNEEGNESSDAENDVSQGDDQGTNVLEKDSSKLEVPEQQARKLSRGSVDETGEKRNAEDEVEEKEIQEDVQLPEDEKSEKLMNQFSFCDRAIQTSDSTIERVACQTRPAPKFSFKEVCNQWAIHDAYMENQEKIEEKERREEEEKEKAKAAAEEENQFDFDGGEEKERKAQVKKKEVKDPKLEQEKKDREEAKKAEKLLPRQDAEELYLKRSSKCFAIIERMLMQNIYEDVIDDFKFFEDGADEFRESGDGTLLPLWKFTYDRAKRMQVSCLSWSKSQPDMFAVGYGSHSVQEGFVVIFSIRNSANPEQVWAAPKGVKSVDIHPKENSLVAIGMNDGNVAVLNLKENEANSPRTVIMKNIPTEVKHGSPVWALKWADDSQRPNFYSSGMDGKVIHWELSIQDFRGAGGVSGTLIANLVLPMPPMQGPDGNDYKLFGCARSVAFHPKETTTFIVGSVEGKIFLCSSLYMRYMRLYIAHFLPVASLQWNYYHGDIFISCSEDWTIKIWDRRQNEPMYVFELGVPVYDVCWASYSSTVFAAVTENGKVLVYDLNINKERPICNQQVVTKKIIPLRVEFNPVHPILIIGDDRGQLLTMKLSPNLRILGRDARNVLLPNDLRIKFEVNKMTKLLSLVQDPDLNPSENKPEEKSKVKGKL